MVRASEVMNKAASLLNDSARSIFHYEAQLPYLQLAWQELREFCQANNVPITNKTDTLIVVPSGTLQLTFNIAPYLPGDLIEIQAIFERLNDSEEDYQMMTRVSVLPPYQVQTSDLVFWSWQEQKVMFIGATTDRQLRLDYIGNALTAIENENAYIPMINAESFLEYRTAALCADFIGENEARAEKLNTMAQLAADRFASINTKGRQSIAIRRKPFMLNYKTTGGMYGL